jgi:hypothetical protein
MPALDVLIGLFFLYFLLSIVCSSINEGISSILRTRARFLEQGIRSLLDGEANAKAFYDHWRVQALIQPGGKIFKGGRKPSYMPGRIFALTVLDTFAPPPAGTESDDLIDRTSKAVGAIPSPTIKGVLEDALLEARGDIDRFRSSIERSFDEVMDRTGGWYKRRIQAILFVIALALVIGINADSYAIGQRLWKDEALRSAVVAQANKTIAAGEANCVTDSAGKGETAQAAACVGEVKALALPLGWSSSTSPHSLAAGAAKVAGLLVTVFALTLGAPFWFDLLGKVARIRGSGPTPPAKPSDAKP